MDRLRLDRMVESGRVTEDEAQQLRSAADPDGLDEGIIAIRLRHAGTTLEEAVGAGTVTREEADALLARVRGGEHRAVRAQLRHLRSRHPGAST